MNYWESGMHLALGTDIFESYGRYQGRLLEEYDRLSDEFGFVRIDARRSVEEIQADLRHLADARHVVAQPEPVPPLHVRRGR
jgi:dTMP kinase